MIRFILASQSPRRRDLLSLCGYPFQVMVSEVDETTVDHPNPAENSLQTAQLKAQAIISRLPTAETRRAIIVAADTTVALDGQMLGKPTDAAEATNMLKALRGRDHQVHTGMALVDPVTDKEATAVHTALVTMRSYTDHEIERYIATGDPMDKAGAYAIQHPQFRPVTLLDGCYLGVMGLSVCQLLQLLGQLDVPLMADLDALAEAHDHYPCPLLSKSGAYA
jgi:septum formation protein